jgi:integrase
MWNAQSHQIWQKSRPVAFNLESDTSCRVSDVAWLRFEDVHLGPKVGWIHVGHKGGKERDLDLLNAVRKPLYEEKTRNVI